MNARLSRALVCFGPGKPLQDAVLQLSPMGEYDLLVCIEACGVCRTDVHIYKGELHPPTWPVVLGHQIVGRVIEVGQSVDPSILNQRVGIPWLGSVCEQSSYCVSGQENLCPDARFTGFHRFGGFADYVVADSRFAFPMDPDADPVALAPLLCAGLIGYRAFRFAAASRSIGLVGFGSAAHLIAQVAVAQDIQVYAFTRPGDAKGQAFARNLGAVWAGSSDDVPSELLDAAIIFASAGHLVPQALRWIRPGGRVICAGIHMSDIPAFPYDLLWMERSISSVANLTRADAFSFFPIASACGIRAQTTVFPLGRAQEALQVIEDGSSDGSIVLVPEH